MKEKRKSLLFLIDIRSEIEGLESYVELGKSEFLQNETIQKATFFRLQTIGEAVNKLPDELKDKHPNTPWRDVVAFRNLLVHRYWRIDLNTVWEILTSEEESILDLKPVIQDLIDDLSS